MDIKITPTPAQIDSYEAIRKAQLLCEAENALLRYFEADASSDLHDPAFEKANGFSLSDAINPKSPHYILEGMVDVFEERMTYSEGNISANACWEIAVESLTNPCDEEESGKELYKVECEVKSTDEHSIKDTFVLFDRDYTRLKQTVGAVFTELCKCFPDGEYEFGTTYEGKYTGYIDSDEGTAVVKDGELKIEY